MGTTLAKAAGGAAFLDTFVNIGNKLISFFASIKDALFGESLKGIDSLIRNLHSAVGVAQSEINDISRRLRNAKKNVDLMRTELNALARETITKADQLVGVLNDRAVDEGRIRYAASRMIHLVNRSLQVLGNFKGKYVTVNEEMSELLTKLDGVNFKLDESLNFNFDQMRSDARHQQYLGGVWNLIFTPFTALSFEASLRDRQARVRCAEASARNCRRSTEELAAKVREMESYIDRELSLLCEWERRLNEMSPDFDSDDLVSEAMRVNRQGVVEMLHNLKEACDNYIQAN